MTERVTLDLTEHRSTDEAYLLSRVGDDNVWWIPKSLCSKTADGRFEIDRWKAKECGLLAAPTVGQMRLF